MTAGRIRNVFQLRLEFGIILGFIGLLNLIILEHVLLVIDISAHENRPILERQDNLVLQLVVVMCDLDLSAHLIYYKI